METKDQKNNGGQPTPTPQPGKDNPELTPGTEPKNTPENNDVDITNGVNFNDNPKNGNDPTPQEPKPGENYEDDPKPQNITDEELAKIYEKLDFKNENVDDDTKNSFLRLCNEQKINTENAQKLLDMQAKLNADYAAKQEAQRVSAINGWKTAVKKNYGVDCYKKLASGKKALQTYGSQELVDILGDKATGLANHPAIVDFLVKIGEALENDTFVKPYNGRDKPLEQRTEAEKARSMYPNM